VDVEARHTLAVFGIGAKKLFEFIEQIGIYAVKRTDMLGGSAPPRMVQFTRSSPRFAGIMQDLFAGTQSYLGLKRRLIENLNGSLLEIANKLINAFTGPLFGIYLLAMFSRRATSGPTLVAGIAGTVTSYYVAYHTSIGFMWPSTFGLAATLAVGWMLAAATPARPTAGALRLTWRGVMEGPNPMDMEHVRDLR
jgi:hypothetical protein